MQTIEEIGAAIFNADRSRDGIASDDLRQAENRLRVPLPRRLFDLYSAFGNNSVIMTGQDRILAPAKLHMTGEMLVFCEERQRVVCFGVPITNSSDDPIVMQAAPKSNSWFSEELSMSCFLKHRICWQAIGGLGAGGSVPFSEEILESIDSHLTPIDCGAGSRIDIFSYFGRRTAVSAFRGDTVYVGVTDSTALERFELETGVDLSWF